MPPRSVFDIVKSHIHLPINRDYDALKHVLRDWHHYSARVPLQAKPTFPAELHITITRPSPAAQGGNKSTIRRIADTASVFGKSSRRWSLWRRSTSTSAQQQQQQHSKDGTGSTDASSDAAPKVYKKVIPLHVWTAVLPWEMQRGLSFSELRLPDAVTAGGKERATVEEQPAKPPSAAATKKKAEDEEEEEDPYGVVTSSAAAPPPLTAAAPCAPPKTPAISVAAPTPAMLFLSDMVSTRSYGIGFWSGGIVQPIDVFFVAPTLPVSVGPHSPSFQQLREQDGRAAVEENHVSQEVLTRYFPLQEVSPPAARFSAASSVTFQVHSFSHLDPLPPSLHPSRLDTAEGRAAATGRSLTAAPDAPYASLEESPRYVFEAPRHTLQPAVAAALKESRRLVMKECGAAAEQERRGDRKDGEEDANVVIDMTVRMSADLRADLFAKAQLCVEYVSLLEEAIAHYAQELNTDHTALAMSAQPLAGGAPDAAAAAAAGAGGEERNRPIKVWLSEHESRWMTPDELRRAAQSKPDEDHHKDEGDEDAEGRQQHTTEEEEMQAEEASPSSLTPQAYPAAAATTTASTTSVAARAAQAVGATAAQPGAVTRSRSIGRQSPMLVDETEGRPSYLAPSFVGRHESATLQQSAVVLSADKLARYPKTHSHMPQLLPIDYELFDLCTRLGVGQRAILYHYHDRMLKEWRTELQRRRSAQSGSGAVEKNTSLPPPIDPEDVERMVALVRDRSLQVSPELVSLVEAVVAAG